MVSCFFPLNQNEPDGKALLNKLESSHFYSPDLHGFYGDNQCSNSQDAVCDASLKKYCNAWGHTAWNLLVKYGFLLSEVFIVVKQ